MKEGMARVIPRVYGIDKDRQQKGKKEGMTTPDIRMNFVQGQGRLMEMGKTGTILLRTWKQKGYTRERTEDSMNGIGRTTEGEDIEKIRKAIEDEIRWEEKYGRRREGGGEVGVR